MKPIRTAWPTAFPLLAHQLASDGDRVIHVAGETCLRLAAQQELMQAHLVSFAGDSQRNGSLTDPSDLHHEAVQCEGAYVLTIKYIDGFHRVRCFLDVRERERPFIAVEHE